MLPEFLDLWQRTPMSSIRLINAYGPTETTITATAFDITPRLRELSTLQRIPIGRPLTNRETYILNKYGNPVPIGVPGELYIGGAGLARGYLNRADLTAENFIPNPFSGEPGARLYKTGDLARYLSDGNIEFLGRVDHQVKIRGFRIELGEIEAVLRQHPAVRETVVLARQDTSGEQATGGVCRRASGNLLPTAGELRGFLKEKLPDYMMPAVFVPLDALPLMPNGKVDRGALPEAGRTRSEPGRVFVAPRNALELQLASLWEEVLGVRPIGVTDNFFELGGHSLAAVRLFALIEKRLGKKVPLATVFQGATVEHLANILRQHAKPTPSSSLVAIQPGRQQTAFLLDTSGRRTRLSLRSSGTLLGLRISLATASRREGWKRDRNRTRGSKTWPLTTSKRYGRCSPRVPTSWEDGPWEEWWPSRWRSSFTRKDNASRCWPCWIRGFQRPTRNLRTKISRRDCWSILSAISVFHWILGTALARLPKHELLERVLEHAKRAGLMPSDIEVSQAQPFIELCKADFRATRNYVLHHYPGRITLFKAGQELAETSSDPTLGWSEWAAGGVDVDVVPGNHATMVYKPHVEVLAEKLRACLDQLPSTEEWFADEVESIDRIDEGRNMNSDDREDTTTYKVVVNHEEQYSIWPAGKKNPLGWTDTGKTGSKTECLAYIKEVWTDMRPLSLRRKMDQRDKQSPFIKELSCMFHLVRTDSE